VENLHFITIGLLEDNMARLIKTQKQRVEKMAENLIRHRMKKLPKSYYRKGQDGKPHLYYKDISK